MAAELAGVANNSCPQAVDGGQAWCLRLGPYGVTAVGGRWAAGGLARTAHRGLHAYAYAASDGGSDNFDHNLTHRTAERLGELAQLALAGRVGLLISGGIQP